MLVTDGDRVLLVKHSYRDGWFLPGGTPESGESLAETACREVLEETGVEISEVTLFGIYSSLAGPESAHVVVFVGKPRDSGAARVDCTTQQLGDNPEIEHIQWVPAKSPPQRAMGHTKSILQNWRQELTGTYCVVENTCEQEPNSPQR